jgi:hypothetical protein
MEWVEIISLLLPLNNYQASCALPIFRVIPSAKFLRETRFLIPV